MLIVTKLDRLGRNAIDVATTVARLAAMGCGCIAWRLAGSISQAPQVA